MTRMINRDVDFGRVGGEYLTAYRRLQPHQLSGVSCDGDRIVGRPDRAARVVEILAEQMGLDLAEVRSMVGLPYLRRDLGQTDLMVVQSEVEPLERLQEEIRDAQFSILALRAPRNWTSDSARRETSGMIDRERMNIAGLRTQEGYHLERLRALYPLEIWSEVPQRAGADLGAPDCLTA